MEQLELHFACTILAWAEWNGECNQFIATNRTGRLVVADSAELLVLELVEGTAPEARRIAA